MNLQRLEKTRLESKNASLELPSLNKILPEIMAKEAQELASALKARAGVSRTATGAGSALDSILVVVLRGGGVCCAFAATRTPTPPPSSLITVLLFRAFARSHAFSSFVVVGRRGRRRIRGRRRRRTNRRRLSTPPKPEKEERTVLIIIIIIVTVPPLPSLRRESRSSETLSFLPSRLPDTKNASSRRRRCRHEAQFRTRHQCLRSLS